MATTQQPDCTNSAKADLPQPVGAHGMTQALGAGPSAPLLGTQALTPYPSLGEHDNPLGAAANDDEEPPVHKRKRRRKPARDDRRRSRTTLTISKEQYQGGRDAWYGAQIIGLPLDTFVTLRPRIFDEMTPVERHAWTRRRIRSLGQWYADNDDLPPFTALWSRESKRIAQGGKWTGIGEHIHMLVHAGTHRDRLEKMLSKSLKLRGEVDVRPAKQTITRLRNGWMTDASTYVLKAVNQRVWRSRPSVPHRKSGPIYGARVGWTQNLGNRKQLSENRAPRAAKPNQSTYFPQSDEAPLKRGRKKWEMEMTRAA
ncbi:hypothetical protein [Methylobacterium komagatae]